MSHGARNPGSLAIPLVRGALALALLAGGAPGALGAAGDDHARHKVRTPPAELRPEEARAVELYRSTLSSTVTVVAAHPHDGSGGDDAVVSMGSGVLVGERHDVLTAAHVVQGAPDIKVRTHDGVTRTAHVIYSQPSADIALLRLDETAPELKSARLGDSDRLAVGQTIYAIGAPLGFEDSFSIGHISGFREFGHLYDGTILAEFIQTDAAINLGSSGGPLFDSQGAVVGIASRIVTHSGGSEGLGFAVAINTAKELIAAEDRPWLGIEAIFVDHDMLASFFNLDLEGGLLVQDVVTGSPAEKAGLKGGTIPVHLGDQDLMLGGDLILEFNNQEACHSECLERAGTQLGAASEIPVKLLRAGKLMEVMVNVSATHRNFLAAPAAK